MAKPLGPKSILIRKAIESNPDLGNTELAELINSADARKSDKIKVKPGDIAAQKQAMKKAGKPVPAAGNGAKRRGRSRVSGLEATAAPAGQPHRIAVAASVGPVDLIDKALDLAQQCGGVAALKRLVDRLADMQRW